MQVFHVTRKVTVYPVLDSDLQMISMFNGLGTVFASVAAGWLTFGVGLIAQAVFVASGEASDGHSLQGGSEALTYVLAPISFVMCAIFAGLAAWALIRRGTRLKEILREAKSENADG